MADARTTDFDDAYEWRKSTRSTDQGGNCIYIAGTFGDGRTWRKATQSGTQGGNCVYAASDSLIGLRDGKAGQSGEVAWISPAGWSAFVTAVKASQFTN